MKKFNILFCLLSAGIGVSAQSTVQLSLEEAQSLARKNYPLIKQNDLISRSADLSISALGQGLLPQISLNAQATYQSDVTRVNIPIPGITVPTPGRDQYKATADVSQLLYDGGTISGQKNLRRLNADVENERVEVELYKVRERINQLYFGLLLLDEQLNLATLVSEDINTGLRKTEAQVNNGVTFRSNLDVLKAQFLLSEQKKIELLASKKALINVLSLFTGLPPTTSVKLSAPAITSALPPVVIRPEMSLFSKQTDLIDQQKRLLTAKILPKASLFGQGGYGKPGLNLLDNNFDWFYIAGVRLNWSLGALYTNKKEKQLAELDKKAVALQQEVFLLNTNAQLVQQRGEMEKLQQLIVTDREIITLRGKIKQAANAQLENQVITANDYLREVNAEDQARQSLALHQVLLLQAEAGYITIAGQL